MTTHIGDDRGPYYRIHKDATGESVAVPEPRDHTATGREQADATAADHDRPDATNRDQQEDTTMAKATGRATRRGAEISIGLLVLTATAGIATYYLTAGLLRWNRDLALVLAGLVSGLLASNALGPLWQHARQTIANWITPGRTRS